MEPDGPETVLGLVPNSADSTVDTDEQLALRAREQYRESGVPTIPADEFFAARLEHGEQVLSLRDDVVLRRVEVHDTSGAVVRDEGRLYVTNQRLMHFGAGTYSIALAEIDELSVADDRILVTLTGSRGVTLDVAEPHQLRVLIAAAKAALRTQGG